MINYCLLLVTCCGLLHVVIAATHTAPWKNWTFCKKGDPAINQCLVNAIRDATKDIIHGSSYFGLPELNPLHLDELSMFQAGQDNKAVAVNLTFTNCFIRGFSRYTLSDIQANWDAGDLKAVMTLGNDVVFDADYVVNGKIILLPVKGKGKTKITFERMKAPLHVKGHLTERKGKQYFEVDSFDIVLQPEGASFNFGDLFNGQTALSESINRVLNENWQEVLTEVKKPVGEGLGAAFKQISNRIFSKIPYEILVPV